MEQIVFGTALLTGVGMALTACLVYFKKQLFGLGGSTLTLCAVVLIGMSVWSNINVSVSEKGFEAKLQQVEHKVTNIEKKSEQVEAKIERVENKTVSIENKSEQTSQTVKKIKQSFEVMSAQKALKDRGYDIGFSDGYFGPKTQSEIKRFQTEHSLDPTGQLDERTLKTLGITPIK